MWKALQMLAVAVQNILILLVLSGYYMEGRLSIADFTLYFSSITLLSSTLSGVTNQMFSFSQKLLYCGDFNRIVQRGKDAEESTMVPQEREEDKSATISQSAVTVESVTFENVSLREKGMEDSARLWGCLKKVELDGLVGCLKEKEYTHISRLFSENGVELSGGERQRLGIARAVYKDAQILVLDEPAASLDVKMEEELYRNFYGMTQGKISLTVSHRLSQAAVCNKIFVLNQGIICEEGTHGELMEMDGVYAAMFRKQREAYIL